MEVLTLLNVFTYGTCGCSTEWNFLVDMSSKKLLTSLRMPRVTSTSMTNQQDLLSDSNHLEARDSQVCFNMLFVCLFGNVCLLVCPLHCLRRIEGIYSLIALVRSFNLHFGFNSLDVTDLARAFGRRLKAKIPLRL